MQKDKEELRKEKWLRFHDRKTKGIPGMLPLVVDLPIRFTDVPNPSAKALGVFKNSPGWLRGWSLPEAETERLSTCTEPEIVLVERPIKLYIEVATASKELPLIDGKPIYTLSVQMRMWSLDDSGNVKMLRYGFPIVPDFGGTAHAYCGTTLNACLGDLLEWHKKPSQDGALRG